MTKTSYELIDCGRNRKLERFGPYVLDRPSLQAVWEKKCGEATWREADATFTRDPDGEWTFRKSIKEEWTVEVEGISFLLRPTDFGHLGIFPEQQENWRYIIGDGKRKGNALNLFAYSGGSTFALAKAGFHVCHLDASKKMVAWARENAELNHLENHPIRWIVDDVRKFIKREIKRGSKYEAIVLDPPSFGRGTQGEVFKIDDHLLEILADVKQLFSDNFQLFLLTCHTPGFTPLTMKNVFSSLFKELKGTTEWGEMVLPGEPELPSGVFVRWQC